MRFILPAWLGILEALSDTKKKHTNKILKEMLNQWPFFYAMMDMLDMVLVKTDQRVIEFYEECLADRTLKNTGRNLRGQLNKLIKINKEIMPKHILEERESYRNSIKIRNTYSDILNLLQADVMKKLNSVNKIKSKSQKDLLTDTMMVTVAGISAGMKNTG